MTTKKIRKEREPDKHVRKFWLALVREVSTIWEESTHGAPLSQLAERASLSVGTVQRALSEKTRFPEFETIGKLALALGLEVELREGKPNVRRAYGNRRTVKLPVAARKRARKRQKTSAA